MTADAVGYEVRLVTPVLRRDRLAFRPHDAGDHRRLPRGDRHASVQGVAAGSDGTARHRQTFGRRTHRLPRGPPPATVNYSADGVDATARLAHDLRALIDQHAASLERPELARRDAAEVAEELASPVEEQDRDRLSETLKHLAGRVGSVSVLAEATKKLTDLLFS
jgi:lactam utilization protein B